MEIDLSKLFQVDMTKKVARAVLGPDVIAELSRAIALLERLRASDSDELQRFRKAFIDRYQEREVPLTEVLDEEVGIGFGELRFTIVASSLVDGLEPSRARRAETPAAGPQFRVLSSAKTPSCSSSVSPPTRAQLARTRRQETVRDYRGH